MLEILIGKRSMLFTSAASREGTINHLQMLWNLIMLCDAHILISTLRNVCVESWLAKRHTKAHSQAGACEPAVRRLHSTTAAATAAHCLPRDSPMEAFEMSSTLLKIILHRMEDRALQFSVPLCFTNSDVRMIKANVPNASLFIKDK